MKDRLFLIVLVMGLLLGAVPTALAVKGANLEEDTPVFHSPPTTKDFDEVIDSVKQNRQTWDSQRKNQPDPVILFPVVVSRISRIHAIFADFLQEILHWLVRGPIPPGPEFDTDCTREGRDLMERVHRLSNMTK